MPREEHIMRQVTWKKRLEQYGKVELEKQLVIRGARIVADVYAQIEGKEFIIEIGDIGDNRKNALLQFYAESKPNVVFIREAYGENKIQEALEQIKTYLRSPEYIQGVKLEIERIKKDTPKKIILGLLCVFDLFIFALFLIFINYPQMIQLLWGSSEVIMAIIIVFSFMVGISAYADDRQKCKRLSEKLELMQSKFKLASKNVKKGQRIRGDEKTSKENKESDEKMGSGKDEEEPLEHDITYGDDTWEQEDDEWTEELDSVNEMEW